MRKTKFTFFLILVVLTGVLVFIIIGENDSYDDPANLSVNIPDNKVILSPTEMLETYQDDLSNILYEYQQEIALQSLTRDDAIKEIREKILSIAHIPADMKDLHLKLVLAFSRDLNGYREEAIGIYKELQSEHIWLFSRFNFLVE
ncbi:hypothetical protein ISR92_00120 [Patescibacteria group bacterium]|nr:hypothetical protein [Patescibacteria group bacterium]